MPIVPYKSSSSRRIFTNHPFRKGMNFTDMALDEGASKTIVNYDISSGGDSAQPRSPFVNAVLHDNYNLVTLPTNLIKQTTNLGKTFLIGSDFTVNEEDYVTDIVGANVSSQITTELRSEFGLHIANVSGDISAFTGGYGFKAVYVSAVIDGDTIDCVDSGGGDTFRVRLIGVNTPESGEDFYTEATDYLENLLDTAAQVYLVYDPLSDHYDYDATDEDYGDEHDNRQLAYVFTTYAGSTQAFCMNTAMLLRGFAEKAFLNPEFLYYDAMTSAYDYAVTEHLGIHTQDPLEDLENYPPVSWTATYNSLVIDTMPEADYSTVEYFQKKVSTLNNVVTDIYDTKSYFDTIKVKTDLISVDDQDVIVQMLVHEYESQEYEYVQKARQIPHVNMSWRNAITFFGRIIDDGILLYKGMITLQYDGTEHYILIQRAHEVNMATFTYGVAETFAFNALDDDPYIYEDYYGADASAFLRPSSNVLFTLGA